MLEHDCQQHTCPFHAEHEAQRAREQENTETEESAN
jgi:hypothetical protein